MAVKTVTTREFVCDNCGESSVFDSNDDACRAGWALLDVNGKQFALCPEHYRALKAFLMIDSFKMTMPGLLATVTQAPPEISATVHTGMQDAGSTPRPSALRDIHASQDSPRRTQHKTR